MVDKEEEIEIERAEKPTQKQVTKKSIQSKETPDNQKDSINWMINILFLRHEFEECLGLMNKFSVNKEYSTQSPFSIYLRALIKRNNGEITDSLDLLRKCYSIDPHDLNLLKEIGKSLLLTGKFTMAIDIFDEVLSLLPDDWESFHYKGECSMNLKSYEMSLACFNKALSIYENEKT